MLAVHRNPRRSLPQAARWEKTKRRRGRRKRRKWIRKTKPAAQPCPRRSQPQASWAKKRWRMRREGPAPRFYPRRSRPLGSWPKRTLRTRPAAQSGTRRSRLEEQAVRRRTRRWTISPPSPRRQALRLRMRRRMLRHWGAIAKKKKLPKPTAAGVEEEEEEEIDENAAADPDEAGAFTRGFEEAQEGRGAGGRRRPGGARSGRARHRGGPVWGSVEGKLLEHSREGCRGGGCRRGGRRGRLPRGWREGGGRGTPDLQVCDSAGKEAWSGPPRARPKKMVSYLMKRTQQVPWLVRRPGGLGMTWPKRRRKGPGAYRRRRQRRAVLGPSTRTMLTMRRVCRRRRRRAWEPLQGADEDEAQEAGVAPEEAPLEEAPKKKKKSSFSFGFFGSKSDPEEEAEKEGDVDSLAPAPSEADTEDVVTPLTTPGSLSASTKPGKFLGAVPVGEGASRRRSSSCWGRTCGAVQHLKHPHGPPRRQRKASTSTRRKDTTPRRKLPQLWRRRERLSQCLLIQHPRKQQQRLGPWTMTWGLCPRSLASLRSPSRLLWTPMSTLNLPPSPERASPAQTGWKARW
eukprot:jgi/Botrbrau1/1706/Bobra.116_2s0048.1